ncbi:MAG TPA: hypothetical protein VG103_00885 [Chthoniobacterales bacterium]|jgi:hypothetical protein|nr:hypothetical protein [Chthoniobacterales bacterium]
MGAYYFNEFVRIVLGLLPIALILIAMIFLRRQHRTRHTIFLQWLAGVWLAAAAASRLVLSQVVGMGLFPKDGVYSNPEDAMARFRFYDEIQSLLHFIELGAFILFAVALLIFCRQNLQRKES